MNDLFVIIRMSRLSVRELAKLVDVSRNRIGQLIAPDELPRNVKLETLDEIAKGLGHKVEVNFVKDDGVE